LVTVDLVGLLFCDDCVVLLISCWDSFCWYLLKIHINYYYCPGVYGAPAESDALKP